MAGGPATAVLRHLPLVDAHCHQLLVQAPDDMGRLLTEGDEPGWDTAVGLAVRRWCGPALDLPPLATPAAYLERRAELGHDAVTARLLGAARLSHLLVDTGPSGPDLALPAVGAVHDVVRLELVAEELAATAVTPADFAAAFAERLDAACRDAVAVKSIVAYRHGLDLDPARPAPAATPVGRRTAGLAAGRGRGWGRIPPAGGGHPPTRRAPAPGPPPHRLRNGGGLRAAWPAAGRSGRPPPPAPAGSPGGRAGAGG